MLLAKGLGVQKQRKAIPNLQLSKLRKMGPAGGVFTENRENQLNLQYPIFGQCFQLGLCKKVRGLVGSTAQRSTPCHCK